MELQSTVDRLLANNWVKVTKKMQDDRKSLCGEKFQRDQKTGEVFCFIPAHQADYQKQINPRYQFEEDFYTTREKTAMLSGKSPLESAEPETANLDEVLGGKQ